MKYSNILAKELNWGIKYVENVITLLDEGNTIPFIARYRKEMTNTMDEMVLRDLETRLNYLRNLDKRKEEIIKKIDEQGKLTEELRVKIIKSQVLKELEDLYTPYKQKRRTRATIAREKGLGEFAKEIIHSDEGFDLREEAAKYLNEENKVTSVEEALKGAADIICEEIHEDADLKKRLRMYYNRAAVVKSKLVKEEPSVYDMYSDYEEEIRKILPHRILAMNRGEKEEFLNIKIVVNEEEALERVYNNFFYRYNVGGKEEYFREIVKDAFKRLIHPGLEREFRNELTEVAHRQAISVFSENLQSLLMQSPVKSKAILGLDPGYRTGCKLAVVDEMGSVLEIGVIYPHPPQKKWEGSKKKILELIKKWDVELITIGNGTASRESELLVSEIIKENKLDLNFIIVSEAGASVYSASEVAIEEFPTFDVSERSAVSIARRIQDPLAELVKIEPKSIGVGQYQHDLAGKTLDESLKNVVESCVNQVGVELNTASASLLQYVAGLNKSIANNIVKYREENRGFKTRKELLKVPRLGEKAFVQAAGFIRIRDGKNPIENTSVHPEAYKSAEKLLGICGMKLDDLKNKDRQTELSDKLNRIKVDEVIGQLEVGKETLKDIVSDLKKPGRDPRENLVKPLLKSDVLKIDDLKEGMLLEGTITNVVDFGAFVDIGLKNDGLCHISELTDRFVKHPLEVVSVGNIVRTRVLSVDKNRNRVSLSFKI